MLIITTLLLSAVLLTGLLNTWILFKIATKGLIWELVWLRDWEGKRWPYGIGLTARERPVGPDCGDWVWQFKFRRDPNLVRIAQIVNGKLVRKA